MLVGHPFDLVKVKMQTAVDSKNTTTLSVLKDIIREKGPLGLYQGISAPILAVAPIFALR